MSVSKLKQYAANTEDDAWFAAADRNHAGVTRVHVAS